MNSTLKNNFLDRCSIMTSCFQRRFFYDFPGKKMFHFTAFAFYGLREKKIRKLGSRFFDEFL